MIGFQGSCSDKFESGYLVADFTVEGSGGVGDVTLSFEGEGEVIVVKTSVISSGVWISVFCLGCCFSPIGIIISGIKLSKSRTNTSNTILFVNDTSQQGTSLQQMEPVYRPVDESGAEYDSHEISELMAEGYEREQAIAIAKDK